ncbi:MAG: hypothetical protein EAY65_02550 [Alphaproteobacteria bacterium]|nr:MAG: hypothetical protein EAY65_02550 [Alphaproteobacteria bacterium]
MMHKIGSVALMLIMGASFAHASEIVYRPINPSFGGNPFNSSHLIGLADAQNDHERPEDPRMSNLESFERTITSSLLNRISSEISDRILGENAQESGTFLVGNTRLDFQQQGPNVLININDLATGGQTSITIPNPRF